MQLSDSYLHSLCLEKIEEFGKDAWIWVRPPGLEGVSKILSTLEDTGVAHKAKNTKELLSMIQSSAVFSCVQIDKYPDSGDRQDVQ